MVTASVTSLFSALVAALVVSLVSVVGVLLIFRKEASDKALLYLLSLSAGGMMGTALFHLLPEAIEEAETLFVFAFTSAGFLVFFIVEKLLHLYHCHYGHKPREHRLGYLNLFSDGLHNFLDGIAILVGFAVSFQLGSVVTLAVILHEIPQEIGDFGVLLYAGFTKTRALFYNFLVALTALAGVVVGYALLEASIAAQKFLIPLAAGSFLYITATNLIPEIHKEERVAKSIVSFVILVGAVILMYLLKIYLE